jgi:hypothetical protein
MKKMLVMLFFCFMSLVSFAPDLNIIYIPESVSYSAMKVSNYDSLINAISLYESGNCDTIVNRRFVPGSKTEREMATGRLQIRPCRVKHYNELTGKNYTVNDMCDFRKAREVFLYFAKGKTYEQAAKSWNGSGPLTITYWEKIKALI